MYPEGVEPNLRPISTDNIWRIIQNNISLAIVPNIVSLTTLQLQWSYPCESNTVQHAYKTRPLTVWVGYDNGRENEI